MSFSLGNGFEDELKTHNSPFPRILASGLPFILWVYFVLGFIIHPESQIWHWNLVDSDDYLYLVQALNWIHGQAWWDTHQARINPPEGSAGYFSPLMTLLYGIPIKLASRFREEHEAAILVASFFPLAYLAGFLTIVHFSARQLLSKSYRHLTAYVTFFCLPLLVQFIPGRVDHHGLVDGLSLFAVTLLVPYGKKERQRALIAGIVLGLSLALALETLPVLFLVSLAMGCRLLFPAHFQRAPPLYFGLGLTVTSLILLLIIKPFPHLADRDMGQFSFDYCALILIYSVGMLGLSMVTIPLKSLSFRLLFTVTWCACLLLILIINFPELIQGPFGTTDQAVLKIIFGHSGESWPLRWNGPYALSILIPFFSFYSLWIRIRSTVRAEERWWLILYLSLILSNMLMAFFIQQRTIIYAEVFSIIFVADTAQLLIRRINPISDPLLRATLKIAIYLAVGPLTTIILPATLGAYPHVADLIFYPVQIREKPCDQNKLIGVLDHNFPNKSMLILNGIGQGDELLFRTPHSVMASPYHYDREGNLDAYRFLVAEDPGTAHAIAVQRNIDLVILCQSMEDIYKRSVLDEEKVHHGQTFYERLVHGERPPWLKVIEPQETGSMLLFQRVP